jgi:hypothetical protein
MTDLLFVALYVGLIVSMFVLLFTGIFWVGWVFFGFLFVAVFGGMMLTDRPYLIAAGFLLTSLIVLGAGLFPIQQSWQTNTWPTARGVITRSRSCTQTTSGDLSRGVCIEYRYRVNDQTFEGSSIVTDELAQRWWPRIPDSYQEDQGVEVHYDPSNPGISRLAADIQARDWITTIIGAIMAALSAFTLFWVLLNPEGTPQTVAPVNSPDGQTVHPPRQARPRRGSQKSTTPNIADQLEKLAELHQKQAITDEEYELAKKRLLGG